MALEGCDCVCVSVEFTLDRALEFFWMKCYAGMKCRRGGKTFFTRSWKNVKKSHGFDLMAIAQLSSLSVDDLSTWLWVFESLDRKFASPKDFNASDNSSTADLGTTTTVKHRRPDDVNLSRLLVNIRTRTKRRSPLEGERERISSMLAIAASLSAAVCMRMIKENIYLKFKLVT